MFKIRAVGCFSDEYIFTEESRILAVSHNNGEKDPTHIQTYVYLEFMKGAVRVDLDTYKAALRVLENRKNAGTNQE